MANNPRKSTLTERVAKLSGAQEHGILIKRASVHCMQGKRVKRVVFEYDQHPPGCQHPE